MFSDLIYNFIKSKYYNGTLFNIYFKPQTFAYTFLLKILLFNIIVYLTLNYF